MGITRRDFLKLSTATGAGVLLGSFDLKPMVAYAQANPPVWTSEAISVCGYCSVGCSMIIGSQGGSVTYVEGNPDSPINQGSLCSKGSASAQPDRQLVQNRVEVLAVLAVTCDCQRHAPPESTTVRRRSDLPARRLHWRFRRGSVSHGHGQGRLAAAQGRMRRRLAALLARKAT